MKIYQCLKCGLTFKSKKQVVRHLQYVEKVDQFTVEYYYQSFNVKEQEVNGVV
jgi:hypothetical protein